VEAARKQVELKREAREAAQREFSGMSFRLENLGRTIHIRSDSLQKADISFGRRLIANDFKNEDAYLAACLSEPERKVLQERAQALSAERAELDARRSYGKFGLEDIRRKRPATAETSIDAARNRRDRLAAERRELRQSIEALRSNLQDDEDFAQKRRELTAAVESQRRECERWDGLAASADGRKDRGFARSLAFEVLLRHANEQLRKMARRRLAADEDRPLGLRIVGVDSVQAEEAGLREETRPASAKEDLSGGEGFIVSLALALGLSRMLGRKRVDSLFLDEEGAPENGLGALDEKALDAALSALAGLGREGKLVGVVSCAEALRGRVAVRIEVVPQGDGRSVVRAPGCFGWLDGEEPVE
jgi:exonuclease SbcC